MTKKRNPWVRFIRRVVNMPRRINELEMQIAADQVKISQRADTIAALRTVESHLRREITLAQNRIEAQAKQSAVIVATLRSRIMALEGELDNIRDSGHLAAPFEITEGIVLTANEVREVFQDALGRMEPTVNLDGFSFELLDNNFYIPSFEDSKRILEWCKADAQRFIPDFRDCDSFAFYVAAMCGIVFGVNPFFVFWDIFGGHVYNLLLTAEGDVYGLEPQTDEVWPLGQRRDETIYQMRNGKTYGF